MIDNKIITDEQLRQLHEQRIGFIYNDYSGNKNPSPLGNVLHPAGCPHVKLTSTKNDKFYFASLVEAAAVLNRTRKAENVGWKRCHRCPDR